MNKNVHSNIIKLAKERKKKSSKCLLVEKTQNQTCIVTQWTKISFENEQTEC